MWCIVNWPTGRYLFGILYQDIKDVKGCNFSEEEKLQDRNCKAIFIQKFLTIGEKNSTI